MKRRKLKQFVIPSIMFLFLLSLTLIITVYNMKGNKTKEKYQNATYVTSIILDKELPVINTKINIINPYTDASVKIGKNYYDYKADAQSQEKSLIYHDNTYMQNSGVDYISENVFDVNSILDETVIEVKEDDMLGKIVEIKHENDYISIYQSLSEVKVKKGDIIKQGQVIGKSGKNELDKEMGNHLHFELYLNGQIVDPNLYLNKEFENEKSN